LSERRKIVDKTVVRSVDFRAEKNRIEIELMDRMSVLETMMVVIK